MNIFKKLFGKKEVSVTQPIEGRGHKGQFLYCYDTKTKCLSRLSSMPRSKQYGCCYFYALNDKNAIRKMEKEGHRVLNAYA